MLSVAAALPNKVTSRPPVILVHGAANSALVWTYWQRELAAKGWTSYSIDLRGHGQSDLLDLSRTGMEEYAADVSSLAEQLSQRPVVMGWSMGGLVAMMVAQKEEISACVALEPSAPAHRIDKSVRLRPGEFAPEEYGITSDDVDYQPTMLDLDREERRVALDSLGCESRYARDERKAGIVIESLNSPLLVVTGTEDQDWPRERYNELQLDADHLSVDGASHWGLVLSRRALHKLDSLVKSLCRSN